MVVNESIVKICLLAKWTSMPTCFESAWICTKRTDDVTGTLCDGYELLLEKIGGGNPVGGRSFASDPS